MSLFFITCIIEAVVFENIIIFPHLYYVYLILIFTFPVMVFFGSVVASLLGATIDMLLIEPLAWVLKQPALDRLVKLVSLSLLVLGFHFDLLAS